MTSPIEFELTGAEGNRLAADLRDGHGQPVIFLHGGGQTRHAWASTARRVAAQGLRAITVDLRGHGDSEWVASGSYTFADYAQDVVEIVRQVSTRFHAAPAVVGASLGGISALAAEVRDGPLMESLVLVDVTPRMNPDGIARIQGFMAEKMEEGFSTLEEAADAVAAYLPNRKRPRSLDGLRKNLRVGPDGRYRWHWDPAFLNSANNINIGARELLQDLLDALPSLSLPILLVRGMESELVEEAFVREFLDLAPSATAVDVSGAGHMVAGDKNDVFSAAVIDFLTEQRAA